MTQEEFNKWAASKNIVLIDEADGFKTGDTVTVINGYGIPFHGMVIKGIRKEADFRGGVFYVWDDAYWFAETKENLKPQSCKQVK